MFDLRQAQIISRQTENKYNKGFDVTIKWTDIYSNETDIINDLKNVHIPSDAQISLIGSIYTGYEYIHSFAKLVQNNKTLTDKQIIQCKRLALQIKKAANISKCY